MSSPYKLEFNLVTMASSLAIAASKRFHRGIPTAFHYSTPSTGCAALQRVTTGNTFDFSLFSGPLVPIGRNQQSVRIGFSLNSFSPLSLRHIVPSRNAHLSGVVMSDDLSTRRQLLDSDIEYYMSEVTPSTSEAPAAEAAAAAPNFGAYGVDSTPAGGSSTADKEEPSAVVLDPVASAAIQEEDDVKPMITADATEESDEEFKPDVDVKSESEKEEDSEAGDEKEEGMDEEEEKKVKEEDSPGRNLWELKRKTEKIGSCTHYREAHVHRKDGSREKFKLGDVVWMFTEDKEIWVGLVLDFYYNSKDYETNVILRWFYNEDHLKALGNVKISNVVKTPFLEHELFFSDDLEFEANQVGVIEGKVHVLQTKSEYEELVLDDDDTDDTDDDAVYRGKRKNQRKYLVRNFFNPEHPARLRLLEAGELGYLLNHPEVKPMWSRFAKAGAARVTYASRGTGGDRAFEPSSKIKKGRAKEVRKGRGKLRKLPKSMEVDEEEAPARPRDGKRQPTIREIMMRRD